jgi:hypothetical protein
VIFYGDLIFGLQKYFAFCLYCKEIFGRNSKYCVEGVLLNKGLFDALHPQLQLKNFWKVIVLPSSARSMKHLCFAPYMKLIFILDQRSENADKFSTCE